MLWLALMVFFSLVTGAAAGLLGWAGGADPFTAVRQGAAGFGGVLLLLFATFHFVTRSQDR
jgi:hypothetical protein